MIYAWHGSEAFNDFLDRHLKDLAKETVKALGDNLIALILAGGYGRGEGGVIVKDGTEWPYNDLDLVLVVKNANFDSNKILMPISRDFAGKLEIHVDFSRPLTIGNLKNLPHKLMWQDLLNGHIILYGPPDILTSNMPAYMRDTLPRIEATHLMLNRGAGLIWSFRIIYGYINNSEEDFVRRNFFKAALAIGDAILIAAGRHQTAYRGRDRLLAEVLKNDEFGEFNEFLSVYVQALQFKFSPDNERERCFTAEKIYSLAKLLIKVFLRIEEKRLNKVFGNAFQYFVWRGIREKKEHQTWRLVRNILKNASMKRFSIRYPRESLFRRLPLLLEQAEKPSQKWKVNSENFMRIWENFN
ncbi:MAG: hypothetical protein ACOYXC_04440 [Candidatus Rifleibacteriota bacterium]